VDRPLPWLRYLDADELDDEGVEFDGMDVQSVSGDTLGDVDGFIVDSQSGRPYYVVVDNDGWFTTKHFLVPVGHIRLDDARNVLVADLTRDRIKKFPGFDKDEFEKMSVDDIRRFNDETCEACSVTAVSYSTSEPLSAAWDRPQYAYPTWWSAEPTRPDRMGARAVTAGAEPPLGAIPRSERTTASAERIVARGEEGRRSEPEPSPHFDGRAQPGDVIGFETGGERTYIGETAEDENKRRRDAEEAARDPKK
jgi:PRC-barrel domain